MKVEKPGPAARANCPSGGKEFAAVVWRYIRVLALAAKAQGLERAGKMEEYEESMGYLSTYLDLLRVGIQDPRVHSWHCLPALLGCKFVGILKSSHAMKGRSRCLGLSCRFWQYSQNYPKIANRFLKRFSAILP